MTAKLSTDTLLAALDELDVREGDVVAALLERAAELRRRRALTAADLAGLAQSLTGLVTVAGGVQQAIARAGSAPPPALDQLQVQLAANAAEYDRLRAELRAGIVALEAETGASDGTPDRHGRTFRLVKDHMHGTDVAHFQRELNVRLARWGVHKRIAESGVYDAQTRLAAHQVAYGLGIETAALKEGITPAVRELIHAPSRRTPDQIARAHVRRQWLAALRKRLAHAAPKAKAGSSHHAAASHNGSASHNGASHGTPAHKVVAHTDAGLAAAIRAHGGRYEDIIIAEARRSNVPVSLVCAVMEDESSFTNVFGHDGVANPIKSVHGRPNLVVTEALYKSYLQHRNRGEGCQGVGPMQLTSAFLQDRADKLGGCFKPGPNIRVGVEYLASLIAKFGGVHGGLKAYNGSSAYADHVMDRARVWHDRLQGQASVPSSNGHGGHGGHATPSHAPGKPRTLRMTEPELMSGSDVKAFQHLLNHRLAVWGIGERVAEDGVYGVETRHAAHQVALGLGLAPAEYAKGMTPAVRALMRTPSRRTPEQLRRAASRRAWVAKLRKASRGATGAKGAKGAKVASGRYPLAVRGTFLGGPGVGTHSFTAPPNNWQSDNAVDLGVPIGTAMIAVDSGRVVKLTPHAQDGSRFAGDAITIVGDHGNTFFYKHGVSSVKVGERVHKGQKIGTSGSASGSAHLHFGVEHGNPLDLIGQHS
ncbi:MAG: peptidoglycan DD-metalloendopeptidase family protein [Solirubrobacteraceae bacterium]